jgi:zinc/manganese transport system substrate-binding protein
MRRDLIMTTLVSAAMAMSAAHAEPINIVAAESIYGDLAQQIGGPNVAVTSILSNPNQDPHAFEASASTARQTADAELVIYNGADYDPWMTKLLRVTRTVAQGDRGVPARSSRPATIRMSGTTPRRFPR